MSCRYWRFNHALLLRTPQQTRYLPMLFDIPRNCPFPWRDLDPPSVLSFPGRSLLTFVSPIRYRTLLRCRTGYTLGSATHL